MRLGILTLHSQTNYGGVLQAYALQQTLGSLGHQVVIIDRWIDERNTLLNGILSSRSVVAWVKFFCRGFLGFGDFTHLVRCRRTRMMLPNLLHLTKYSFCHWKDAPADLGVDKVVVGSDQVWNPNALGSELFYLLNGAPAIPAISYAASFGVKSLPVGMNEVYREGLSKFKALSVREEAGVAIVSSIGLSATHVVDPVFLAEYSVWSRFESLAKKRKGRKLVCYFIHEPVGEVLSGLRGFAQKNNCEVEIFIGGPWQEIPKSFKMWVSVASGSLRARMTPRIHLRSVSTPDEFVAEIAAADWIVTDSFHGLMFSTIFRKNVRVLQPRRESANSGFARLSEFVSNHLHGNVISENLDVAIRSLVEDSPIQYNLNGLDLSRRSSLEWLKHALEDLTN